MIYDLKKIKKRTKKTSAIHFFKDLMNIVPKDKKNLRYGFAVIFFSSGLRLLNLYLIGYIIDRYILLNNFHGLIVSALILFVIYVLISGSSYYQNRIMGDISVNLLFSLRSKLFKKIQGFPIPFFEINKTGDLISRINNDIQKLNNFFSGSLLQFISWGAMLLATGTLLLTVNFRIGIVAISPALIILLITRLSSPWLKNWNALNLASMGDLGSQVYESLNNFKVIVSFNRRDYFRTRFEKINKAHYSLALRVGFFNKILSPFNDFLANSSSVIVLLYGMYLISYGDFKIGQLISCLLYATQFYGSVRVLSSVWPSFQNAIAGWERINEILSLNYKNDVSNKNLNNKSNPFFLDFTSINFSYEPSKKILDNVNLHLKKGRTYAFVGPSGGGKTTLASLMSGLYKPNSGVITLDGKNINTYNRKDLSRKIGYILQDPILFTGTVKENILYANSKYQNVESDKLIDIINQANLGGIIELFENGLETYISSSSNNLSLGQKQLIAFMRAVLRNPELLILDEATANVDTLTEQLLNDILEKLPKTTTKIIIAHRLNTIKNADEIFFVHEGSIVPTGSFKDAVLKLSKYRRTS